MLKRLAIARRIIKLANSIPDASARQINSNPLAAPEILIIIRGRALILIVFEPEEQLSDTAFKRFEPEYDAGARVFYVCAPEHALTMIDELASEQDRLLAYDPRRVLFR